jgi:hypothetical protein
MSISLAETGVHDLTYISVGDDFVLQPGSRLQVDAWGMDSITRKYKGRLDKVATEVAKYKRDRKKRDSIYQWLYYTDLDVLEGEAFAELSVTYKGLYDGQIPEPVLADSGYRRNTVDLGLAEDIGFTVLGNSSTITYNAPFAKVNFVSETRRRFAQHANMVDLGQLQIIKQKNANLALLNIVKGASLNDPAAEPTQNIAGIVGRYNGTFEVNSAITSQKKVGQWWEGTETHEILIVPMEQRIRALSML